MNRMSFFVTQLHTGFLGLALAQGSGKRTGCAASHATLVVTVPQNIVATGVAYNLMAFVPSKPFGSLIPEQDFSLPIRDVNTCLQTVQHHAEDLWILKIRHREFRRRP
jgi:hypothetical protein